MKRMEMFFFSFFFFCLPQCNVSLANPERGCCLYFWVCLFFVFYNFIHFFCVPLRLKSQSIYMRGVILPLRSVFSAHRWHSSSFLPPFRPSSLPRLRLTCQSETNSSCSLSDACRVVCDLQCTSRSNTDFYACLFYTGVRCVAMHRDRPLARSLPSLPHLQSHLFPPSARDILREWHKLQKREHGKS